jgi:hypothetical protein
MYDPGVFGGEGNGKAGTVLGCAGGIGGDLRPRT